MPVMSMVQRTFNKELGAKGERLALELLKEKGLAILDTNWRYDRKELDIIARDGDMLVVVEVKARTWECYEEPADSMTDGKIRNILEATEAYMFEKNIDCGVRFDLVSVTFFDDRYEVEHIADAFGPFAE